MTHTSLMFKCSSCDSLICQSTQCRKTCYKCCHVPRVFCSRCIQFCRTCWFWHCKPCECGCNILKGPASLISPIILPTFKTERITDAPLSIRSINPEHQTETELLVNSQEIQKLPQLPRVFIESKPSPIKKPGTPKTVKCYMSSTSVSATSSAEKSPKKPRRLNRGGRASEMLPIVKIVASPGKISP